MTAGVLSIGWWIPQARQHAPEIARDYGLSEAALAGIGLKSKPVPDDDDHPFDDGRARDPRRPRRGRPRRRGSRIC